jgi:hypothetical protein
MHEIIDKKIYLGPKFGTLFNKKWVTISELLQAGARRISGDCLRSGMAACLDPSPHEI